MVVYIEVPFTTNITSDVLKYQSMTVILSLNYHNIFSFLLFHIILLFSTIRIISRLNAFIGMNFIPFKAITLANTLIEIKTLSTEH